MKPLTINDSYNFTSSTQKSIQSGPQNLESKSAILQKHIQNKKKERLAINNKYGARKAEKEKYVQGLVNMIEDKLYNFDEIKDIQAINSKIMKKSLNIVHDKEFKKAFGEYSGSRDLDQNSIEKKNLKNRKKKILRNLEIKKKI